ncbi:YHS domain-containing (seleno)protein [Aureivirga marina]|uniref:YHS domain-containing (seleno)protein n=1 Tax=Aureivirga marina TaxID=1182451 RepID=UPI0018CA3C0C|nr:YHS domain-containing (seleno)protein [Aureivirga marina]
MKKGLFLLLFLGSIFTTFAQKIDYNTSGGYIADGYDVVSYFNNKAEKGSKKYQTTHDGVKYKFTSQAHLDTFKSNPNKYVPQYGGWCAYALGAKNEKVSINPKTFEIRDGKLYLFYNSWGTNTLKLWEKEGPEKLKAQADKNWEAKKYKK